MLKTNQIENIYKKHKACKDENEHLIKYWIEQNADMNNKKCNNINLYIS